LEKIVLIIFSLTSLLALPACGKSDKNVTIESPEYSTPGNPFFVPTTTEENDNTINPNDIAKSDPCYRFLKNEIVTPVATCTELENGRIKDSYKSTIHGGGLCVLRKAFPEGLGVYTLIGVIAESNKDRPRRNIKIDILGNGENKDQDVLRFSMKGEVKSTVMYSLSENSVTVRTVSKLFKKRYRYYRFSCKKMNSIID
jgi:hypothetical protein